MKRIISTLLLVVVMLTTVVASFTGCNLFGGNKPAAGADFVMPEGGFNTEETITIKFYHSMGAALQEVLNRAIAEFNTLYPNIIIEHESLGDYDGVRNQIQTEITVGGQPHIAYCYPDHIAVYNEAGAVQTLDSLMSSDVVVTRADGTTETIGFTEAQLNDFIQAYLNEGRAFGDGKMYALPISKSTEVLYYNIDALVAAGVVDADGNAAPPKTWEEMAVACEKLKAYDPNCIPLGYDSESNWFITMCEQYGSGYTSATGDNFIFDNETNRNFVKMFREWYQKKWVTTEALSGGYTSNLFTGKSSSSSTESKVPAGTRCYMCIGSTGGASYQQPNTTTVEVKDADGNPVLDENGNPKTDLVPDFEVGITSIPQVNPDAPKVISQGPSICIFKKDNPQEVLATWLFAKFLTTNLDFQAGMSMSNGYAPVIKSVAENEVYAKFLAKSGTLNLQAYAVKVALEQEKAYYASPAFNGSSVARDQVGLLIQKCFTIEAGADLDATIKKVFEEKVAECKYQSGQ